MRILKTYVSPSPTPNHYYEWKQCLSAAVIFRHIIPVVILASLFLITCNNIPDLIFAQNAITIGSNNITGTLSNQTAKIEPKLSVDAACQIGQPISIHLVI